MAIKGKGVLNKELFDKVMTTFTGFLRQENLKMTRERRLILKEIYSTEHHLEAEDLLMKFRKSGDKVSRATIYRTFDLLIKAGLILKSDFGQNHAHYEKKLGQKHHDHIICSLCDKVIEFSDAKMEEQKNKICKENNFLMTSHSLQIFGICSDCAK